MQCNIDQRGRKARLVTGAIVDGLGVILLVTGIFRGETWMIVAGGVMSLTGSFIIFEGAKGWCAARALGFKTRL